VLLVLWLWLRRQLLGRGRQRVSVKRQKLVRHVVLLRDELLEFVFMVNAGCGCARLRASVHGTWYRVCAERWMRCVRERGGSRWSAN
jgi:hypothetical protein